MPPAQSAASSSITRAGSQPSAASGRANLARSAASEAVAPTGAVPSPAK
jgi:hypothetical protein